MEDFSAVHTEKTSGNEDDLGEALKALGHPSRLEILRQLAMRERCCGGDFCDCLALAQSTISQHLDLLKSAGLVDWHQEGTRSIYTLNRSKLNAVAAALTAIGDTTATDARNCGPPQKKAFPNDGQ